MMLGRVLTKKQSNDLHLFCERYLTDLLDLMNSLDYQFTKWDKVGHMHVAMLKNVVMWDQLAHMFSKAN